MDPRHFEWAQPLLGIGVRAGFPSLADDHLDRDIDLLAHVGFGLAAPGGVISHV